jgi:hypothetical protein
MAFHITMDALFEQVIVACAAFAYHRLTKSTSTAAPVPQCSRGRRGRSHSRTGYCSADDSAYDEHAPNQYERRHAIYVFTAWLVVASGIAGYRVLSRLHYESCTGSAFKALMALINPSQCATYEMYLNYMKSLGGMVVFALVAQLWHFFGIDTEGVLDAHQSIRRLVRAEY